MSIIGAACERADTFGVEAPIVTLVDRRGIVTYHEGPPSLGSDPKSGQRIFDHFAERPALGQAWKAALSGERRELDLQVDSAKRVRAMFFPLRGTGGEIAGAGCVAVDLSEQERSARLLAEDEERYRLIAEAISDYSYVVRLVNGQPAGTIHSPSCELVTGYSPDDFLADPYLWITMVPEEDRPAILAQVDALLKGGSPDPIEHRLIRRDGESIWVRSLIVPRRSPERGLIEYAGVVSDITKRKKAEAEAIRREKVSRAMYTLAIENQQGDLENVMREAMRLLADFINVPHVAVMQCDGERLRIFAALGGDAYPRASGRDVQDARFSRVLAAGKPLQEQAEAGAVPLAIPAFGDLAVRSLLAAPALNKDGKAIGILCAADTRPRPFSEDEVHATEVFARHVAFEMERKALISRLRFAEESRMLGQVAASIAREVRNPLDAILIATEVLREKLAGDVCCHSHLDRIGRQNQRLYRLISDLLSLRRPVTAQNMKSESLKDVCARAVREWQELKMPEQELSLALDEIGDGVKVRVDQERISQALANLLENAAHHSPGNSRISLHAFLADAKTATVRIQDEGEGILPEHLDKVFDPFFTTRLGGSGLGLHLVRLIVENHGGRLAIKNNRGRPGCTAEMQLPLSPA